MRCWPAVILAAFVFAAPAAGPAPEYVQAVEFPYYLYPRQLWERELVWLKTIGVRTVEFSIPWNWHQLHPGEYDFNGRTSPRRDLVALIRILRRLDLHCWVRPLPPVAGWLNNGAPAQGGDARSQQEWLKQLEQLLATQTANHGGPVAYVEGGVLAIDAKAPPAKVTHVTASDAAALPNSREAIAAGSGALLWTDVEDALYSDGWSPDFTLVRKGAVNLNGDEQPGTGALRRDAALLRNWSGILAEIHPVAMPKPAVGKMPDSVSALEMVSRTASAISITNRGAQPFHDDVRVLEPVSKRVMIIPGVTVPAGDSLWLPVSISLGPGGLCAECSNFSAAENLVYATAELLAVEFENGILAMEFAAPVQGEAVLQLARKPVGPYLAAGAPTEFDWDDKTLRARLRIPAGKGAGNRVRVGIAIEEPETSAFFNEAHRLVIGRVNTISTSYSSEDFAKRSRLRLPEGYTGTPKIKSPNEIDYEVAVPPEALHGDWVNLGIEADGVLSGRARVQLFRPASIRMVQALAVHFGAQTELTADPPTVVVDPAVGTDLEIAIRNNSTGIQTFRLDASGEGLEFFRPRTEISVAAIDERRVSVRVFGADRAASGLRDWRLSVTSPTSPGYRLEMPLRVLLLPRGRTVVWSADLDGDGEREWVLESQKARAVFSSQDGGRWTEFTWKDGAVNFLPDKGAFAAAGAVEVRAEGDGLEFSGKGWRRSVRLAESTLTVEQNTALPADGLAREKRGNVALAVSRGPGSRAVYTLAVEKGP